MSRIKILIVDTQAAVRQSLRTLLRLEEDLEILGEAADGVEAIRLTDELGPQVILMDMMISMGDGLHAVREIKSRHPQIGVVLLSSCTGIPPGMREHEIDAIVVKEAAVRTLVKTIRRIRRNTKEKTT